MFHREPTYSPDVFLALCPYFEISICYIALLK